MRNLIQFGLRGGSFPGPTILAACLTVVGVTHLSAQPAAPGRHPLMRLTSEQMTRMTLDPLRAEPAPPRPDAVISPPHFPSSLSLLSWLPYNPAERNQGHCGNCWAWAGTGVMEIAHNLQNGVASRLSVQLLNSCNPCQFLGHNGAARSWHLPCFPKHQL